MRFLARSFLQGLAVVLPVVLTGYVLYAIVRLVDTLIPTESAIIGIAIVVAGTTLIGVLISNVVGRRLFMAFERLIRRVPVVKLFYSSIKDLLSAFIGDRKSFENPVLVLLDKDAGVGVFGFVTCESFDDPKLNNHVSVYLPQSYNFAGNLIVVERSRVQRIDAVPSEFMAFVMSGGVAKMSAARTIVDPGQFKP